MPQNLVPGEDGHAGPLIDEDLLVGRLRRIGLVVVAQKESHLPELLGAFRRQADPGADGHRHRDFRLWKEDR